MGYSFLLTGVLLGVAAHSVFTGWGPLAECPIEIGNQQRSMSVPLHRLVVAWQREHGLMQQPKEQQPPKKRPSLASFVKRTVVKVKTEHAAPKSIAWVPMPDSWHASLVVTITNAHTIDDYFDPVTLPKPSLYDMVVKQE